MQTSKYGSYTPSDEVHLQVEEKKNEGLQVTLEESVTRNAQLLKDKEQQEAAHQLMKCKIQELQAINQEIQCKLQDMERKKSRLVHNV